jgi:hypothetical protein
MNNKRYLIRYLNLGFQFFFILIVSTLLGYFIDYFFDIRFYIFTMTLPLISFFYSLFKVYKNMKK